MKFWSWRGIGRAQQASFADDGPAASTRDADRPTADEELLRRFTIERDERAYEAIVARYGDMVWGVCRRVLGCEHDAEDAFQAVFLVLARKAETLRRGGSLPAWLHQTAFRLALRCRTRRARQRTETLEEPHMIPAPTLGSIASEHDQSIVDAELNALPERYRLPLFLCCVEGKSLEVAARQLGWSLGSVKGRLERGRQALRSRLLRRKVPTALGFALLAATTSSAQAATSASVVPAALIVATTQAGMQVAAGRSALGYVSQNAVQLTHGSSKVMYLVAANVVAASLTAVGALVVGAGDSPASTGVGASSVVTLDASFTPSAPTDDFALQLALADREGDRPREGAPRDGDRPREGAAREGDRPREGGDAKPREGAPREGAPAKGDRTEAERLRKERLEAQARSAGTREGDKPRTGGEGAAAPRNPLNDFQPQTPREKLLYQMILDMQREMGQLRQMVQQQNGANRAANPSREGGGSREGALRDGDKPRESGARDGDKPREGGARDGDRPREGGERRDGAPSKEGGAREGAARDGDQ